MRVWPGNPYPLGATWDGAGVNFALFAEHATKVELCLFDSPDATQEAHRLHVKEYTDKVWHACLPDVLPGQLYGYRIHGPYEPANGHRFNSNKVVLDPYAKLIGRNLRWDDSLFGYKLGDEQADLSFDDRDSAAHAPLASVIDPAFTWGDDRSPRTPWHKTIIYELHVKGFTQLNPHVPEHLRGSYAGLASESAIKHLTDLGVTAVELLPVHHYLDDRHLVEKGLHNYWGYNTLGFFAPASYYSYEGIQQDAVQQFKMMVRAMHAAGLEVILDVVYNHTAEGNQMGPTLSMRGVDNAAYYRLAPDPRYYMDFTGTGNTLNMTQPFVLQLIMDSLRYWVSEMHVDGFRFDLASTLARELFEVNRLGAFFDIIHQDPLLSQVKLIAEPWDVGPGGYQVGNFPVLWTEWNGIYRDNVRRFWKGDGGTTSELATRLTGSSDLYQDDGRKPYASINFITCHDGFTLQDLVSYNEKHNEDNGEENRDGANDNNSWNCGEEGPTDDPDIIELRERQKRNLMSTLMLSVGVPMMLGGDELGHGQQGNNNTYCQDNELNWLDWELDDRQQQFLDFTRKLIFIRRSQPVLHRRKFFLGRAIRGSEIKDISFFNPSGQEMSDEDWNAGFVKCLGVRLAGDLINDENERGEPITGETLLFLLNGHWEPISFTLPLTREGQIWDRILDTADTSEEPRDYEGGKEYPLQDRSFVVLAAREPRHKGHTATPEQMRAVLEDRRSALKVMGDGRRAAGEDPPPPAHRPTPDATHRPIPITRQPKEGPMDPNPLAETLLAQAAEAAARARLPESTYRLQLHAGFTFRDATAIAPYLRDLGITHAYSSPYLKARPGSTHGYDIVNHGCLNPEIGTEEDYEAWVAALREGGLGQILDTVPNHMGVGTNENAWWNDVLENGPASRYGAYFDIAWRSSPRPELQDKILLSVLGDPYGDVLEAGQLELAFADGAFSIHYYDRRFPVAPRSYSNVLGHRIDELEKALGPEAPAFAEYQSILTAIRNLPEHNETEPERMVERQREKEVVKRRLSALSAESEPVRRFIEENVAAFNGRPGDPRSFDLLDGLMERQCYRLAYWRVAPDEINYRRFFDINDLAALSMEREDVFEAAHRLVLRLVAEGKVDGLRIDHPDGLYDPEQYFRRLQEHHALTLARRAFEAGPGSQGADWSEVVGPLREAIAARLDQPGGPLGRPLYVVAEKILGADEALVETWPTHGTSGYDFLNQVNGLFVDPDAGRDFTRRYNDHVEDDARFSELVYRKKLLIMLVSLSSELHMLTNQLDRLAQKSRRSRDFTFNTLRQALGAVIAAFPVYRSYIADDGVHDADRRTIEIAVRRATARNPLLSRRVFRFIRDMLLLESLDPFTDEDRAEQRRFAGKFQQVTAPVTAKGVEDTAFYVYNRLVSLNEVGGEPGRFGLRPEAVHAYNRARQARWPYALSPLLTHDTKRSEDVRARINVLSEMAEGWWAAVDRWSRLNEPLRSTKSDDDQPIPDANEEYLLYQTLVGAWPPGSPRAEEHAEFVKRIQDYMLKALHEAKLHSSWINPNAEYDEAVGAFIGRILDEGNRAFLDDFRAFQRRVAGYGLYNSLSQTLLKLASPGAPDTYQGTELWDFSLVDPDNRRPVDYERRVAMLRELRSAIESADGDLRELARELVASKEDGRIKLYVNHRSLACRRDHPGLFTAGEYIPQAAEGPKAAHLFAFARRADQAAAIVAVPRLVARLTPDHARPLLGAEVWSDTRLPLAGLDPSTRWRHLFTGEILTAEVRDGQPSLAAADLFAHFPVALLLAERGD